MTHSPSRAEPPAHRAPGVPTNLTAADALIEAAHRLASGGGALRRQVETAARQVGLSDRQFLLLWHCRRCAAPGIDQSRLAALLDISAAQVSGLVEQLRSRLLLSGTRDQTDRRRQVWQATAAGEAAVLSVLGQISPHAERLLADLSTSVGSAMRCVGTVNPAWATWPQRVSHHDSTAEADELEPTDIRRQCA